MHSIKVEGHSNLERDAYSGAIINKESFEYENYQKLRKIKENQAKLLQNVISEVDVLRSELSEIKSLLLDLRNNK